jgi:hypothetical protein
MFDLSPFVAANIDENTGCPIGVSHVCRSCAEDQARLGCYCELTTGDVLVTADIFTQCPTGRSLGLPSDVLSR